MNGNDLDISVIIATHNRDSILSETLERMVRLDRSGINVEFIIADNNSSDKTKDVAMKFSERLPVRYLFESKPGQNCARNKALAQNQLGKIVAFTDDDVNPDKNWFQSIVSVSRRRGDYSIFGGQIYPIWPKVNLPRWTKNHFIQQFGFAASEYANSECLYARNQYPSSGNFWVRREIITNGRRFDESIEWHPKNRIMATETTFLRGLSQDGYRMFYTPEAVIGHKITAEQLSLAYLIKRAYSWGRGAAHIQPLCRRALLDRHPGLWQLIRIGAIARLTFNMAVSVVPTVLKKPQKSIQAMQWIGYNIESIRIAKVQNDS